MLEKLMFFLKKIVFLMIFNDSFTFLLIYNVYFAIFTVSLLESYFSIVNRYQYILKRF
jgi:hypothetical protein